MGERQGGYNRQKETTIHRSSSSDSERHTTKTKSKMLSSLLQGFGRQGSHSAKIVGMAMTVSAWSRFVSDDSVTKTEASSSSSKEQQQQQQAETAKQEGEGTNSGNEELFEVGRRRAVHSCGLCRRIQLKISSHWVTS